MNKTVFIKLAQLRLAINYVLRNRMTKQANPVSLGYKAVTTVPKYMQTSAIPAAWETTYNIAAPLFKNKYNIWEGGNQLYSDITGNTEQESITPITDSLQGYTTGLLGTAELLAEYAPRLLRPSNAAVAAWAIDIPAKIQRDIEDKHGDYPDVQRQVQDKMQADMERLFPTSSTGMTPQEQLSNLKRQDRALQDIGSVLFPLYYGTARKGIHNNVQKNFYYPLIDDLANQLNINARLDNQVAQRQWELQQIVDRHADDKALQQLFSTGGPTGMNLIHAVDNLKLPESRIRGRELTSQSMPQQREQYNIQNIQGDPTLQKAVGIYAQNPQSVDGQAALNYLNNLDRAENNPSYTVRNSSAGQANQWLNSGASRIPTHKEAPENKSMWDMPTVTPVKGVQPIKPMY